MKKPKLFIALLRIALGWVFLYQGFVAFTTSNWSVLPMIQNAKTFPSFYNSIIASSLNPVSFIVKLLFVLVGALLIAGIWNKIAAFLGIVLMFFFYFPLLHFPYVGTSYFIVDEHIIFIFILAYLFVSRKGRRSGFGSLFKSHSSEEY